jgi:hypothetical protein
MKKLILPIIALLISAAEMAATPNDIVITQANATTGTSYIQTIIPGNAGELLGTNALQKVTSFNQTNPLPGPLWLSLNATGNPPGLQGVSGQVLCDLVGGDGSIGRLFLDSFGANSSVSVRRSDGTNGSPTAIVSGDIIGGFNAYGYNGSSYTTSASGSVAIVAAESWSPTANGTYLSFFNTAAGTTASLERMRIWSDGGVAIGNSIVGTDPGASGLSVSGNLTVDGQFAFNSNSFGLAGIIYANPSNGTATVEFESTVGVQYGSIQANSSVLSINAQGSGNIELQTANGPAINIIESDSGSVFYGPIFLNSNSLAGTSNQSLTPATTALVEIAGATTVNWALGNSFSLTLNANLTSVTFSNVLSGQTITIAVTNTASNYTVAWGNSVKYAGGSQPVQTTGATTDVWTFADAGGILYASVVQNMH